MDLNKDILQANLEALRKMIPTKPSVYSKDFPKTIEEALIIYSNQGSVTALAENTNNLNKLNWPLPLWMDLKDIQIGSGNLNAYIDFHNSWDARIKFNGFIDFKWLWVPVLGNTFSNHKIDKMLPEIFDINIKHAEKIILSRPILVNRENIIKEIFAVYKQKHYAASISLVFPLIDFVIRKTLNATNLTQSINKIVKLFKECGLDIHNVDHLMPSAAAKNFLYSEDKSQYIANLQSQAFKDLITNLDKYNFGIIGPALSSFLLFSNSYYSFYYEDQDEINIINRHAILHGSINEFDSKINAIKLITYLILILELEPVFKILFNTNAESHS